MLSSGCKLFPISKALFKKKGGTGYWIACGGMPIVCTKGRVCVCLKPHQQFWSLCAGISLLPDPDVAKSLMTCMMQGRPLWISLLSFSLALPRLLRSAVGTGHSLTSDWYNVSYTQYSGFIKGSLLSHWIGKLSLLLTRICYRLTEDIQGPSSRLMVKTIWR